MLSFFVVSVVIYLIKNGFGNAFGWSELSPTYEVFIASVPILLFKFAGSEVGSNAAEEMENPQRDVPIAVLRSGIATLLLYGLRSWASCSCCRSTNSPASVASWTR